MTLQILLCLRYEVCQNICSNISVLNEMVFTWLMFTYTVIAKLPICHKLPQYTSAEVVSEAI